jgi:hypothetical protein
VGWANWRGGVVRILDWIAPSIGQEKDRRNLVPDLVVISLCPAPLCTLRFYVHDFR